MSKKKKDEIQSVKRRIRKEGGGRKASTTLLERIDHYTCENNKYMFKRLITIDQSAIVECSIKYGWDLDLYDVCIYTHIRDFIHYGKPEFEKDSNGNVWYWVTESKICHDMPLLQIGRAGVYKRITRLIKCGLLERNENNSYVGKKLFRLGVHHKEIEFKEAPRTAASKKTNSDDNSLSETSYGSTEPRDSSRPTNCYEGLYQ
jgi:hypothetical protein